MGVGRWGVGGELIAGAVRIETIDPSSGRSDRLGISMAINPRTLEKMMQNQVISRDRPCPRCDYNLRGLSVGGVCPECGYPISAGRSSSGMFVDTLVDAPIRYLKQLTAGLALLALGGVGLYLGMFVYGWLAEDSGAFVLAGASVAWWLGVFIITTRRPMQDHTVRDAILENSRVRWVLRCVPVLWFLAGAAASMQVITSGPGSEIAFTIYQICVPLGLISFIAIAIYLSSLAEWASDEGLVSRIRLSAWGLGVGMPLIAVGSLMNPSPGPMYLIFYVGSLAGFWMGFLASMLFGFSLVQLMLMGIWATNNATSGKDRDIRVAELKARHSAEMAERSFQAAEAARKSDPANDIDPLSDADALDIKIGPVPESPDG